MAATDTTSTPIPRSKRKPLLGILFVLTGVALRAVGARRE